VPPLSFHFGLAGALAPFALFFAGAAWLGWSQAPDERGFWPILIAALVLGLLLARDRRRYSEILLEGMARPVVMLMVMAWLCAGILSTLLGATGFVEGLVWVAHRAHLSGGGYVAAAFLACCLVSTSTGTSFGTLLICGPLLYPAGAAVQADPAVLIGAILGGATFGDSISPISDTTIASAGTQGADIGGVVKARLKYVLPAAGVALVAALLTGHTAGPGTAQAATTLGHPRALPMVLVPLAVIGLLLARRHLVEGLLGGILLAVLVGLGLGLLTPGQLLRIEPGRFTAQSLVIDGIERGIGVSIFTLLLVGLVATLEATGLMRRLVELARGRAGSARGAEVWIVAVVTLVVLLTTHSVVAILAVGEFTKETGERFGLTAYRRANLLDVTVCTWPFLLPYFLPTLLAASATASGAVVAMPRVPPLAAGLHNAYSWALVGMVLLAVATGYGRSEGPDI
jgi:Na+/H+ antiporter NhaC